MSRSLLAQKSTAKVRHVVEAGTAPSHILMASWTEIIASLEKSACAIEVLNTTGRVLVIAIGQAGSEEELTFYIMPSVEPKLFPVDNLSRGERLSLKAVDSDVIEDGQIIINLYG